MWDKGNCVCMCFRRNPFSIFLPCNGFFLVILNCFYRLWTRICLKVSVSFIAVYNPGCAKVLNSKMDWVATDFIDGNDTRAYDEEPQTKTEPMHVKWDFKIYKFRLQLYCVTLNNILLRNKHQHPSATFVNIQNPSATFVNIQIIFVTWFCAEVSSYDFLFSHIC